MCVSYMYLTIQYVRKLYLKEENMFHKVLCAVKNLIFKDSTNNPINQSSNHPSIQPCIYPLSNHASIQPSNHASIHYLTIHHPLSMQPSIIHYPTMHVEPSNHLTLQLTSLFTYLFN